MNWSGARTYSSREAWLAARRLGSSDVAAILGLSSFRGPWDVWESAMGTAPPRKETADQRRGNRWERRVLEDYQDETGREVLLLPPWTMFHGPEDWQTSTPDSCARDEDGLVGIVEAKTDRRSRLWGESRTLERWFSGAERIVRPDYAVQCYHQLLITGAPWCDLAVLLPSYEIRVYRLFPDYAIERKLLEVLGQWWERHVVGGEPPSPDASRACRRHAQERIAAAARRPRARAATTHELTMALSLYNARENRKHYEEKAKILSAELADCLEPGDAGLALEGVAGRPKARAMWQKNHFRFYGLEADRG